jgi:hypothetical protein
LTAHAGGEPSATQRALIEQAVQIKLRLAVMDRKFAETGAQTEHDGRQYLAWANSLARLLRQLGMQGTEPRPPSIAEYFAAKAAATPTSGPPEAHNASPQKSAAAPILVPATGRGEAV